MGPASDTAMREEAGVESDKSMLRGLEGEEQTLS
jgi:hypothetical protein